MAEFKTLSEDQIYQAYLEKDVTSQNGVTVMFNMVSTMDGVINVKKDATSPASDRGLSHPIDQKIMRILRSQADCVLNGATTLRISGSEPRIDTYPDLVALRKEQGKPANPMAAVMTSQAVFSDDDLSHAFFTSPDFVSVCFVTQEAPQVNLDRMTQASKAKEFHIVTLPSRADNAKDLVETLKRDFGVSVLLVEGGSGINGSFLTHGLGNHFFLTITPKIAVASRDSKTVATALTGLTRDEMVPLTLASAYYNEDFGGIFEHWQIG